jgi:hypothetical protein
MSVTGSDVRAVYITLPYRLPYGPNTNYVSIRGSISGNDGRWDFFLFATASRPALGPNKPLIQWVPRALSPEVNRPGREADHSPPSSAEVKNTWSCTSTAEP